MGTTTTTQKPGTIMRHCAGCNAELWRYPSDFYGAESYCSRQCRMDARRVTLTCAKCGTAFERRRSQARGAVSYCSLDCYQPSGIRRDAGKPRSQRGAAPCPPWPEVRLPEDDPRQRIRARFRAVREKWAVAS